MSDATPTDGAAQPPAASEPTPPEPPVTPEAAPTPQTAETPAPAAAEAPAAEAPGPAPVAETPTAGARTVSVPMWVLVTIAAVIGAVVMFGIGYAIGDGSNGDADTAVGTPFQPNRPNLPNPPNQGGNGNQQQTPDQQTPSFPNPQTSGAFLGVATQPTGNGLEITEVVPGSAADDAGLETGDVITEFDGDEVSTPAQLASAVAGLDPGDEAELAYERDGKASTVTVELGSRNATNSN